MTTKCPRCFFGILIIMVIAGCATSGQKTYVAETKKGKKIVGEEVGHSFDIIKKPNTLHTYILTKRPYCSEEVEEIELTRTRSQDRAGVVTTAFLPFALFMPRVGQPLLDTTFEKSRGETASPARTVSTGKVVPCGKNEPAPNEEIILQSSEMKILKHLKTDANGLLKLESMVKEAGNALYLNLYIKNKGSAYYVSTIFIR